MSTQNTLLLAINLATVKRDQALAFWQHTLQAQAHANDQMQQLKQYADETEQRWTRSAQQSTSPELLQHHYQFMGRLYQTMGLQDSVIAAARQKVDAAKKSLIEAEFRLSSLKKLVEVKQREFDKKQHRRDQKQMDEFAAQQTQRQRQLKTEEAL